MRPEGTNCWRPCGGKDFGSSTLIQSHFNTDLVNLTESIFGACVVVIMVVVLVVFREH